MPLPVIADAYRCSLNWTGPGGNAVNVLHITTVGSTALAVANQLDAAATSGMWTGIVLGATVTSLHVTPLDGSSATTIKATSGAKWSGGASGDYVPQASYVIGLRTSQRGPSKRGRLFLPFAGEAGMVSGFRLAVDLTAAQSAWNTWLSAMTAAAFLPCVVSYKHSSLAIVTTIQVESPLGTQRRRQSRLR